MNNWKTFLLNQFVLFILFFSTIAGAGEIWVEPNPGVQNSTFTFNVNFSNDASNYDVKLGIGDGGGGWLVKDMNGTGKSYYYSTTISQAGNRQYRIGVSDGGDIQWDSVRYYTVTAPPSISSVSVNPTSAESGSTFTFYANLSGSLPSSYSMQVDFGAGYKTMSNSSGNTYSYSDLANSVGSNRTFTVRMRDASNSIVESRSGTYTVTESPETQYSPNLTISSASSSATQGSQYCISLNATDQNNNLKNLFVNWGDDPNNVPDAYSYNSYTGSYTKQMCHTFSQSGQFTWSAEVFDHTGRTDSVSRSVSVVSNVPSLNSISVNPASAVSGSTFTFFANLSGSLPSGYSMQVDFGAGYKSMANSSGNTYSHSGVANTVGVDRTFTVQMRNASNSVIATQSSTYTVTEPSGPQYAPILTIVSESSHEPITGGQYCISLKATDQNNNLRDLFVNWGDSQTPESYSYSSNNGDHTQKMCHIYTEAYNYEFSASVYDHTNRMDDIQRFVSVTGAQRAGVEVEDSLIVNANQLIVSVSSHDEADVVRTSFTIFHAGSETSLDIGSLVSVNSPNLSSYNSEANSWGYNPVDAITSTNWNIDISGLPDGNYEIEFYAADGVFPVAKSGKYQFSKISDGSPTIQEKVSITDSGIVVGVDYKFSVQLSGSLPSGYGVFINFDDLKGEWFEQNTPGGHLRMNHEEGNTYSVDYSMNKPGLRSFRAGIFELNDVNDTNDDVLIGTYSAFSTCTLDSCVDAINGIATGSGYGNPASSGSGSQLFKQIDVASGNYHLGITDISTTGKGPAFAMTRAYNSLSTSSKQWSFAYEAKAEFVSSDAGRIVAIGPREDGRIQHYFKDMDQKWYTLNAGNFDQLVEEDNGSFTLYTQGNRLYRFSDPSGSEAGRLQAIKDRFGNALTFNYASNNLVGATDANNRNFTISRDANNRIKRVTDFAQRYVEYTYDSNGMITAVQNMKGGFNRYSYTASSGDDRYRLKTIKDPRDNLQLTINYETSGRVNKLTNGDNQETTFSYGTDNGKQVTGVTQPSVDSLNHSIGFILDDDRTRVIERVDALDYGDYRSKQSYKGFNSRQRIADQGLVERTVDAKNNATDIEYFDDGLGHPSQITDAKDRKTNISYGNVSNQINLRPVASVSSPGVDTPTRYQAFTAAGQATAIVDAKGNTTNRAYNGNGWLTKAINARSKATNYEYNSHGNAEKITDALQNETIRTYDSLGRLETEVSPLGLTTSYTYDLHSNIKTKNEKAAGGIDYTTQYGYDASDNLIWSIDPRAQRTDYEYDALNRKTKQSYSVDKVLHTRTFNYDAIGRLASMTNERSQTSNTHYDSRSKVKYKLNPLQETSVSYTYDKNANVATTTDGEGRTITFEYDELNRKTKATDEEGNYQQWVYNTAGQEKTYRDSQGQSTHYEYDAIGNLTKLTDPNKGITRSTYDANSNVLTVTDPNEHTTTYTYDALDRRTSTTLHNGEKWLYTYDANGNQLTEQTPNGERTVQEYDPLNRVIKLSEYAPDDSLLRQISYTYDANSNVLTESSSGNNNTYTYDEINRVSSVTDQYGQTISYAYDKAGNRTKLTYPGNKIIQYAFDEAGRLASLTDWLDKKTEYSRNKAGQPTKVSNGNGTFTEYDYDEAGRLTKLLNKKADDSIISSHDLVLDGMGNITKATVDLPLLPTLPASTGIMTYNNNNRLTSAGDNSYPHDDTGRIVEEDKSGNKTIYNFDINDHITSITKNAVTLSAYEYDLNNNRIKQVQNGVETRYVIDQLAALPNVVAETDAQGVITNYYLYGEGLVSQISAANDSHYYHFDPTGHTLALSDSSGNVTDSYAYAPYGFTTKQGSTLNPFLFVGKHGVMDDGNGLHYMRARYYKEDIKRFVSLDALHGDITSPQALNRYAYALDNPVTYTDPSGLSVKGGVLKIAMGGLVLTATIIAAPAVAAGGGVLAIGAAGLAVVTGVSGFATGMATGVSELVATSVIEDKAKLASTINSIDSVGLVANPFYSGGYVISGGNENVALNSFRIGEVVSFVSSVKGIASSAQAISNGKYLGLALDVYSYGESGYNFSSSFGNDRAIGPVKLDSNLRCEQ